MASAHVGESRVSRKFVEENKYGLRNENAIAHPSGLSHVRVAPTLREKGPALLHFCRQWERI